MDLVNTPSLSTVNDNSVLFIEIEMMIQQQLESYETQYQKFAGVLNTKSTVAKLPFLLVFPQFRKWALGTNRHKNNYVIKDIQVENIDWELTVDIPRPHLMDDLFGVFLNMAPSHVARESAILRDREIVNYMENQASTLNDWDGVPYFDGYHPIDPSGLTTTSTQSNLFPDLDDTFMYGGLTPDNYKSVRASHLSRRLMDNSPMGLRTTGLKLMVHPEGEWAARIATSAGLLPISFASGTFGTASNVWASLPEAEKVEVITNSFLKQDGSWYLLSGGEVSKPFYWSNRMPLELTTITDPTNPSVFERNVYTLGG